MSSVHNTHTATAIMGSDSPNLRASGILPPEILDKILEHVIRTGYQGKRTLSACALVATWWTGPSQRRLFSSVSIDQCGLLHQRWVQGVVRSGSRAYLLGYVRSLRCTAPAGNGYQMRHLPRHSGEYLSGLHNLSRLAFYDLCVEHLSEEQFRICFSAFRETLAFLSLQSLTTSFSAFVALVDYFPNITTLQLHLSKLIPDEVPVPTLSRPLRGTLRLTCMEDPCVEFSNRLAKLELEYEELVITSSSLSVKKEFLESALKISANTVRFLRFIGGNQAEFELTISNFQQLQELQFKMNRMSSSQTEALLSSITSPELQRIIFQADRTTFLEQQELWDMVDKRLCGLVNWLRMAGYRHTLKAELRFLALRRNHEGCKFSEFLPKFREKGVVTIKVV